ncbi:family 16 glycosylhydrolase [Spirosoma sp. KUDC1026]|uniref:glycoside hydrolase family 16 protein n=1 Tax=Spirosoma sp. KUDC1026 TaxID=2745947 RepID=UPI00159BC011|nr:glycoside hydrolase family 16 protein [Spirosoma sp. KUDC1026]QKZ13510.1 glycoside hydrolase family 16 protein [Spirosoma sp. KUDC1026]
MAFFRLLVANVFVLSVVAIPGHSQSVRSGGKAPNPESDTTWKLVWSDEFTKPGAPDPKNWQFEKGFARNHEDQWYQADNARCANGLLTIEARREQKPNPTYQAGSSDWRTQRKTIEYTSASLNTKGLHQWQYGRFEMRGRIDISPGMWPAFWTLGVAGEWPSNGEIDIMEYYRNDLLANVAWGTNQRYKAEWRTTKKPVTSFNDPDWASKFHVWRMDWDETGIRLYVDDQLLNSVSLQETINQDGTSINPFKQPHYVLLNLALGGDNGGDPSKTTFPRRFEIDYVRVYQR